MYLLLDANVTAGYYLSRSLGSLRARKRVELILNAIRAGAWNHFLYIPNFCIAEVISVFMKYGFGHWNKHVQKAGKIDRRVYQRLVRQFQIDIHNGKAIYQYELSRYHILGINLVAPIDHHFQVRRGRKNHRPMSTFDHLIISMGIQLAHIHGASNVCILTSDRRLADVLARCKSPIKASTIKKLKLSIAKDVTGKPFSAALFPRHLDLATATKQELASVFGNWPPPSHKKPDVYRWTK